MPKATRKVRKNLRLSPDKLARAQKILGTATETETVEQALDLVAFRKEVIDGVRRPPLQVGAEPVRSSA